MNDFTEDELTDLLFCVKDHTGYQGDSIHNNLISKIQSLIDSYCDHSESKENHNPSVMECKKCGDFFVE